MVCKRVKDGLILWPAMGVIMEERYTIAFAGECLPGHDVGAVRHRLGQLFKADDATLDRLFSGKRQTVKRDCDKATALKYKQAMEQAGAKPVISRASSPDTVAPPAKAAEPAREMTAAERIAAVAASSDQASPSPGNGEPAPSTTAPNTSHLSIEPAGADVLRPEERDTTPPASIDTSALSVDDQAQRLSEPTPTPPPAPATDHLDMGAVGEEIPRLASEPPPPPPDISALDMSEANDFSDCAPLPVADIEPDLSGINLAPEGSSILDDSERKKDEALAPDTSHLRLDDS